MGFCECGCGALVANRYAQGHNSKAKGLTPEERFWGFVEKGTEGGCWEWTGATRNGYGVIKIDHKTVYVHRFSFELNGGVFEEGQELCHTCDNRLCVNPQHIFQGTRTDNIRDMYGKGRGRGGGKKGVNPTKLTKEQVLEIRSLASQGVLYPELSRRFGVTIPNVCLIVKRKRWANI